MKKFVKSHLLAAKDLGNLESMVTVGEYCKQGFVGTSVKRFGQGCNTQ